MVYKKIKSWKYTEAELRKLWEDTYCGDNEVYTFDGVKVQFYADMFDHAFFESSGNKKKDKSILSYNRCEKILWIKDTLKDPDTILKKGYVQKTKSYTDDRRVALVKDNYVVVILFVRKNIARFITAYQILEDYNLEKAMNSPDWEGREKWME